MTASIFKLSLWVSFFLLILLSWIYIYNMSLSMGLDLFGKKIMAMSMKMDFFLL